MLQRRLAVRSLRTATLLIAVFLGSLGPSCAVTEDDACTARCDCSPCSDADFEACIDGLDRAREAAVEEGCANAYVDAVDCAATELVCEDEVVRYSECRDVMQALAACIGRDPFDPNP